jgi:hypothetical protein
MQTLRNPSSGAFQKKNVEKTFWRNPSSLPSNKKGRGGLEFY